MTESSAREEPRAHAPRPGITARVQGVEARTILRRQRRAPRKGYDRWRLRFTISKAEAGANRCEKLFFGPEVPYQHINKANPPGPLAKAESASVDYRTGALDPRKALREQTPERVSTCSRKTNSQQRARSSLGPTDQAGIMASAMSSIGCRGVKPASPCTWLLHEKPGATSVASGSAAAIGKSTRFASATLRS